MTMRQLTTVAALLAAVLTMRTGVAKAQETVRIAVPSSLPVGKETDFIAITGVDNGIRDFGTSCMRNLGLTDACPLVKGVIVDSDGAPAAMVFDEVVLQTSLTPGVRVTDLLLVGTCSDAGTTYKIFDGTIASLQNAEFALVITPDAVALTAGHEATIVVGTGELGIADAVCVKQGSPSIKTPIISDTPLEAGDRLTDFVEVDFDPETGETMYACRVEY